MNITEILRRHAATRPGATAIIDSHRGRQRSLSFAELERASARAAALLWQEGLVPGEALLVFQPMSAELYIALLAIFRLGLVAMFLDPAQGKNHIEQCCALHPPQALIASPKAHLLRLISPALRRIPHKFVITDSGKLKDWSIGNLLNFKTPFQSKTSLEPSRRAQNPKPVLNGILSACPSSLRADGQQTKGEAEEPKIDNAIFQSKIQNPKSKIDKPALLTFTSGSTGQPKAVMRTHGFLLAQHRVLAQSLALTAGQVDLTTMPIVALANLGSGVTSLIPKADLRYPGAIDPAPLVAQIQAQQVVSTVASPALLERLARYCLRRGLTLPGLAKIFTGGAPVFPGLLDQLQQVAPQAKVVAVYGSTEAEPMAKIARCDLRPGDIESMLAGRGLLVGPPVEAIQLKIMPDRWGTPVGPYTEAEFAAACCPAGGIGEIVVSGDHVLSGYWRGQGDYETKFQVNGVTWHRTGDAGYLDEQGRLWLLGRCAARIEDKHGLLYPFAVECTLSHHPDVRRTAAVAHEGRRIVAVEFYQQGTKSHLARLKQSLAWAHIDEVRVFKQIPVDKRHNAKIDYPALDRLLAEV
jgi:acyl-CoA synthetase (AMP-forming)/AMP-acid ligase II